MPRDAPSSRYPSRRRPRAGRSVRGSNSTCETPFLVHMVSPAPGTSCSAAASRLTASSWGSDTARRKSRRPCRPSRRHAARSDRDPGYCDLPPFRCARIIAHNRYRRVRNQSPSTVIILFHDPEKAWLWACTLSLKSSMSSARAPAITWSRRTLIRPRGSRWRKAKPALWRADTRRRRLPLQHHWPTTYFWRDLAAANPSGHHAARSDAWYRSA